MTQKEMFGNAEWVSPSEECRNPYLRKSFNIGEFKSAVITVCGLGFYNFYLNGEKATEDLFATFYTNYNEFVTPTERKLGHRIICQKYDITDKLSVGENVIGFMLGEGYYNCNPPSLPWRLFPVYGSVKLCFNIEVTLKNGEVINILSDSEMKWHTSFITECEGFVLGETHDYNFEEVGWNTVGFDDSKWTNAVIAEAPVTNFTFTDCPPDRVIRKIIPEVVSKTDEYTLYDLKENVTGVPVLYNDGSFTGTVDIAVSEAETLWEKKPPNCRNMRQYFKATLDKKERYFKPELTWLGCRYITVPAGVELSEFLVIHSDVKVTSSFTSSDKVLNWLYEAYVRTQLDNMHVGIPMDCPTEERAGYTGDGQLCCEAAMTMLDAKAFYRKWIDDIVDCQDKRTGRVDYTAPYIGRGGGPGGWGCAIVEVPYIHYKMYGDSELLHELYSNMMDYIKYMVDHSENGLVTSDEPGRWCLGDWCTARPITIPEPYVYTYFLIKFINRMLEISEVIGVSDTAFLTETKKTSEEALVREYFNPETGDFCGTRDERLNSVCLSVTREKIEKDYLEKDIDFCGTYQATNAFALDLGLGNEKTLENLVKYYEDYGMFDCGIFGTEVLLRVLFERGHSELAFKLMSGEGKFSFGAFMNGGATTLHEYWIDGRSFNHPMFGGCTKYLYQYILGIRQTEDSSAYDKVIVNPANISLANASGELTTPHGVIKVAISREDDCEAFSVTVPGGISARFVYGDTEMTLKTGENLITV